MELGRTRVELMAVTPSHKNAQNRWWFDWCNVCDCLQVSNAPNSHVCLCCTHPRDPEISFCSCSFVKRTVNFSPSSMWKACGRWARKYLSLSCHSSPTTEKKMNKPSVAGLTNLRKWWTRNREATSANRCRGARFFPGTFFPDGRTPVAQTDFQSSRTLGQVGPSCCSLRPLHNLTWSSYYHPGLGLGCFEDGYYCLE